MMICQTAAFRVLLALTGNRAVGVEVGIGEGFGRLVLLLVRDRQLAVHLPAHPEQQQAAGDQEAATERQQLRGDQCETDAEDRRGDDADEDGFAAEIGRQTGGGEPDDDGIVAGEHQIDHDNLKECRKSRSIKAEGHSGVSP